MTYPHSYQQQLAVLTAATKKAGAVARAFQEKGFERFEDKAQGDPFLTEADLAIDAYLRKTLSEAFPAYGWLSEETQTDAASLQNEFCWVVDPIDGTCGFIDGQSSFSISVGLVHQGAPVAGAVYAPMEDMLITGAQGEGVLLNGVQVHAPPLVPAKRSVLVSVGEAKKGLWALHQEAFDLKPVGSIAYKIALVAAGKACGVVSLRPKSLHDVCAGHSLILAAGGTFQDLSGRNVAYKDPYHLLTGLVASRSTSFFGEISEYLHQNKLQTG